MASKLLNFFKKEKPINEEIKAFEERPKPKMKQIMAKRGEGWENTQDITGISNVSLQSFNMFYNNYINSVFSNEVEKIMFYRQMSNMPEIADVVEDATNESTQVDENGETIRLIIKDSKLLNNENISNNINNEFNELFNNRIEIEDKLWNMFRNYYIDGRTYYERIIDKNHPKNGIINIKILPSETMDYLYDPISGKFLYFFQYLKNNPKRPTSIKEAKKRDDLICFNPNQIGFIDYGIYGNSRHEIFGFLDKSIIPYNQLKLLETSVIIYRIIRAPERLVFRIDTGNMPRDKALKYVEKIKNKMSKKQSFDASTGKLTNDTEILSMLENYYLPQCLDLNTSIKLSNDKNITLKNLIKGHKEGKKYEVISIDQKTGKEIIGKVNWSGITRKNAILIRINLYNNGYIDVTPDHKFLVWENKNIIEVESQYLTKESNLVGNKNKISKIENLKEKKDTGCLTIKDPGKNHNFALSCGVFVKNSSDGRGSQIETVGGNSSGFTELSDIFYFARKLYRALKYPSSRVSAGEEKRESDIMFGGGSTGEISRDEIKWSKFLERQQRKFCKELLDLFLMHLELKGLKKQYDLNTNKLKIMMTPPSKYKEQMEANFIESRHNNYSTMADREEFSKYFLLKKYLLWSDDEIKKNQEGMKKDIKYGLSEKEEEED